MTCRSIFLVLGIGTLLVMQLGGSCDSDVSVHEDRHVEHVYAPPPPPQRDVIVYHDAPPPGPTVVHEDVRVYDNDHHDHDYDHHGHDDHWPAESRAARSKRHEEGKIRWTADASGTFYVYDVNKDFVRYSGPVHRGQEVIVMPGDDIVYVDQRPSRTRTCSATTRTGSIFCRACAIPGTEADRGYGEKKGGAGDPVEPSPRARHA